MESPPDARWSVFFVVSLVVEAAIIWFAYCGRNWARIICAVIAALTLSTFGTALEFLRTYDFHPLLLSSFATTLLGIVGAVTLFLPAANSWYAAARSNRVNDRGHR